MPLGSLLESTRPRIRERIRTLQDVCALPDLGITTDASFSCARV